MSSTGISIHIGLNHVDPAAYNGWDGALAGCINDSNDMKAIAEDLGFKATQLTESDATADNVVAAIGQAAEELVAGDILFITYSGHGSQVNDVNGDEVDGQDETWVLWDRQLIDDELYALWAQFEEGVRIIMLSDSCHSGTMARILAALAVLPPPTRGLMDPFAAVRGPLASVIPQRMPAARPGTKALARPRPPEPERVKLMPVDVRVVVNQLKAKEIAARQFVAGSAERSAAEIGASVILISGCQDNELSLDGAANGLFTEKLKAVWNEGTFVGSYKEFAEAIVAEMPAKQQPNYYTVGRPFPAFEAQRPFTVAAPGGAPAPGPSPQPHQPEEPPENGESEEVEGSNEVRPVLKRGSEGVHVKELQEYLVEWSFSIDVDSLLRTDDGESGPVVPVHARARGVRRGGPANLGRPRLMVCAGVVTRRPRRTASEPRARQTSH